MLNPHLYAGLPFNLEDLIHKHFVESNRIEFKASWNEPTKTQVVRTICAFANDLHNLNGGYIILGLEEDKGRPVLPPKGLDSEKIDEIQKEIRGQCRRIEPEYQPVLFPAVYQGKDILVIWVPGGDNRPYSAPEGAKSGQRYYYVRQGSETVRAQGDQLRQLMEVAAKVPFDDRRNLQATVNDLSPILVRQYLQDIRSDLVADGQIIDDREIFRKLRIVAPVNSHEVPRNVGLMFFNENPDDFFPGARVEVVQFGDDAGGDLIEEKVFRGPFHLQIKNVLNYLDSLGGTLIKKIAGQAEVEKTVPYPYEAMEEAIVNAVYHRSYEGPPEPVKVYLYPDRLEITSYPGPVAGLSPKHFEPGQSIPQLPARNRRIGEFLKDLRLAEARGTGIPKIRRKMKENGSPEAIFDFAESYFRVILPVHPRYQVIHALREAAHLWAIGEKRQALAHLERTYSQQPASGALAAQLIDYAMALDEISLARQVLERFDAQDLRNEASQPYLTLARLFIDRGRIKEAGELLAKMPPSGSVSDTVEAALLKKRAGDYTGAHGLFAEAYAAHPDDPKIVHEFAQTKVKLARNLRQDYITRKKLTVEAAELLRRAIQLTDDPIRLGWCWYDLARVLNWLKSPVGEVEAAYLKAISLLPDESRFRESYENWRKHKKRG